MDVRGPEVLTVLIITHTHPYLLISVKVSTLPAVKLRCCCNNFLFIKFSPSYCKLASLFCSLHMDVKRTETKYKPLCFCCTKCSIGQTYVKSILKPALHEHLKKSVYRAQYLSTYVSQHG